MGEILCPLCHKPAGEKAFMGLLLCSSCHSKPTVCQELGKLSIEGKFIAAYKAQNNATPR